MSIPYAMSLLSTPQVQSTQRNLPANSQRKSVATYMVPAGWAGQQPLQPSFPVELRDVQMMSVSPSGTAHIPGMAGSHDLTANCWQNLHIGSASAIVV